LANGRIGRLQDSNEPKSFRGPYIFHDNEEGMGETAIDKEYCDDKKKICLRGTGKYYLLKVNKPLHYVTCSQN
jgi:hypothetical protein